MEDPERWAKDSVPSRDAVANATVAKTLTEASNPSTAHSSTVRAWLQRPPLSNGDTTDPHPAIPAPPWALQAREIAVTMHPKASASETKPSPPRPARVL